MILSKKNPNIIITDYGRDYVIQVAQRTKGDLSLLSYTGDAADVIIPAGIKHISAYAFIGCDHIKNIVIPGTVTTIDHSAFEFCAGLISVHIPASVTEIGNDVFKGCENLKNISVDAGNPRYYSAGNCIIDKETKKVVARGAKSIELEGEMIDNHEKEIIYVGSTLVRVTDKFCAPLAVIKEGTKNISAQAFKNCKSLKKVIIPESVTRIGREAFYGCNNLKTLDISGCVTEIGDGMLSGCSALEEMRIAYVGGHDFEEGEYAFEPGYLFGSECYADSYPVTRKRKHTATYYIPLSLKTVLLRKGVKYIEKDAFLGCKSLKRVYISESVETISDEAFIGCDELKNVEFCEDNLYFYDDSKCVINTGKETVVGKIVAFADFEADVTADEKAENKEDAVIENGAVYLGTALLRATKKIPASYTVKSGTEKIGRGAFQNCGTIEEIVIPDGVTILEDEAFCGCDNLKRVYIPDSVTNVGERVFAECSSLEEMRLPNIKHPHSADDKDSFLDLPEFTWLFGTKDFPGSYMINVFLRPGVYVPNSLRHITIGGNISQLTGFNGFRCLKNVTIPDGVTEISSFAFSDCLSLESVMIPNSVTEIKEYAFSKCESLRKVVIPWSVTTIGKKAFANCKELDFVSLPKGISLAEDAFEACPKLSGVKYRSITEG